MDKRQIKCTTSTIFWVMKMKPYKNILFEKFVIKLIQFISKNLKKNQILKMTYNCKIERGFTKRKAENVPRLYRAPNSTK